MPDLSVKQLRARQPTSLRVALQPASEHPQPPSAAILPPDYAELHGLTNFSFQRGASTPVEMVERAYDLGYRALAITDECSVAGIVRAHIAKRQHEDALTEWESEHPEAPPLPRNPGFRVLYGSEFRFDRFTLIVLAHDLEGWGNLCEFITAARTTEAPKGAYRVDWSDEAEEGDEGNAGNMDDPADPGNVASLLHCEVLFIPRRHPDRTAAPQSIDPAALIADVEKARAMFGRTSGSPSNC